MKLLIAGGAKMKLRSTSILLAVMLMAAAVPVASAASAEKDTSDTSWIGVATQSIDKELQEAFNLDRGDGIVIIEVVPDSPADDAGLHRRDIIISFNGKKVASPKELADLVQAAHAGDKMDIVLDRRGTEKKVTVEIGNRPEKRQLRIKTYSDRPTRRNIERQFVFSTMSDSYIGAAIQDLNEQLGNYFGVKSGEGVLITEVADDSPAKKAGLLAGDVIISVDGKQVKETDDLTNVISEKKEGDKVTIGYLRKGNKAEVPVEVAEGENDLRAFAVPSMGSMGMNFPDFKWFRSGAGDDEEEIITEDDRDDFRQSMDEMKKQMEELRQQIKELKLKLK